MDDWRVHSWLQILAAGKSELWRDCMKVYSRRQRELNPNRVEKMSGSKGDRGKDAAGDDRVSESNLWYL